MVAVVAHILSSYASFSHSLWCITNICHIIVFHCCVSCLPKSAHFEHWKSQALRGYSGSFHRVGTHTHYLRGIIYESCPILRPVVDCNIFYHHRTQEIHVAFAITNFITFPNASIRTCSNSAAVCLLIIRGECRPKMETFHAWTFNWILANRIRYIIMRRRRVDNISLRVIVKYIISSIRRRYCSFHVCL